MINYPILNWQTGKTLFTAEIDCDESRVDAFKKRLAVLWAIKNEISLWRADLSRADFSGAHLRDTDFSGADLSRADFSGAYLRDTDFSGADLSRADLSRADFSGAHLRDTDFSGAYLRDTDFSGAKLGLVNFSGSDLSRADLSRADLSDTDFSGAYLRDTDLNRADFSGVILLGSVLPNYNIPFIPNIHQTILKRCQTNGFDMGQWTCESTKCRSGFVCHETEEGIKLAKEIGYNAAGALIYQKSDPELKQIPDWIADNKTAMADMERLAKMEKAK